MTKEVEITSIIAITKPCVINFEDCTSEDDGGAIDLSFDSDGFNVSGCTFKGCKAKNDGGAINICQQWVSEGVLIDNRIINSLKDRRKR